MGGYVHGLRILKYHFKSKKMYQTPKDSKTLWASGIASSYKL